jgi:hypothetical protein
MKKIDKKELIEFIEPNIESFHRRRLENLLRLKLHDILRRKNPYLFKAKNINTAESLIRSLLDAFLSSQEEGIFGGFLEELAIFICQIAYSGQKSTAEGIDLEFEKEGKRYIVSIKSGPNWGNSQQISRMRDNFRKAKRILGSHMKNEEVVAVNGCCYGIDDSPNKGDYLKFCGQRFWGLISGNESLYIDIIEPLGYQAKKKNDQFLIEYDKVINKFTKEFTQKYCTKDGAINWSKLVAYNSGKKTS